MAFLLRPKFLRYLATMTRNGFATMRVPPTYAGRRSAYLEMRHLRMNFSVKSVPEDTKLDRTLRRLDQDVRRVGRISRRELEEVLEELKSSKFASSTQSLLIIRCCGSLLPEENPEVRTQLVEDIWKTLHNLGVPMDISHYNALLRVYLENEHPFSPTECLADIESRGMEPNRVTYQRLVERFCQAGDIEGATHILEFMRAKQMPVNENIFNSLILGHSQAGDEKSAADILNVMKHAGLEPSAETYTILLCGYAKNGDMTTIKSLLEQCKTQDINLLDQDYMEILYTLAINGHEHHVDELIEKFQHNVGFNQDAFNLTLKLINKGKFHVAKKVLCAMQRESRDGSPLPSDQTFIRQLVKANCPIEEILVFCEEFRKEGLNNYALATATESSLMRTDIERSYALLSALKANGYPIRQHYFWPLITLHGKAGNSEGILAVLRAMPRDFEVPVQGETLRDYAVPWLSKLCSSNQIQQLVSVLQSANISGGFALLSVVHYLLSQNDLAGALRMAHQNRIMYAPAVLRKPLLQAYQNTKDAASFAGMLYTMYSAADNIRSVDMNSSSTDELLPLSDRFVMVGQMVLEAASYIRRDHTFHLVELLKAVKNEGLRISNSTAEQLVERLGSEMMTSEISDLLESLTSGEIFPQEHHARSSQTVRDRQLKSYMNTGNAKGEPMNNINKQLLITYCKNRDLENAEKIWMELQEDGSAVGPGPKAQLIDLFVTNGCLEKALNLLEQLQNQSEDFVLDRQKVIRLCTALIKNGNIEGALNILKQHAPQQKYDETPYSYTNACRQLLDYIAEQGDVENLQNIFNALVENGYVEISNMILGPLVKVHFIRNDLDNALKQFEECCNKYHSTPWKNELTCKLIQAEDAASLQKLTDLSTKVHGEINSLYDLVFAFVECGRVRQARKILETPGLYSRPHRLQSACRRYSQEGQVSSLEGLVEATKSLPHIDPSDIYQHLLITYCNKSDAENALGLWLKMQEDNIQPTEQFLLTLGNFLKKEGLPVPFVMPNESRPEVNTENLENLPSETYMGFTSALKENELLKAFEIWKGLKNETKIAIPRQINSQFLETLAKSGRIQETEEFLLKMLEIGLQSDRKTFRFAVQQIALSGNINSLHRLEKYLSKSMKKTIMYNNLLCQAYVNAGKASDYVDKLAEEANNMQPADVQELVSEFPKSASVHLLKECSDTYEQFQRIAEKYLEHGSIVPYNVLWNYHALKHEFSTADDIWNKYLFKSANIKYGVVMQYARAQCDLALAKYVVDTLQKSAVNITDHGFAQSIFIEILISSGKINEAVEYFNGTQKANIHGTAFLKLKTAAEEAGLSLEITEKDSTPP